VRAISNERLYRETITFWLAEPEAFANRNTPTAAELNNAALVFNLTCALWEDETEFTLGDPDTDDGLTYCSSGNVSIPTLDNPNVVFSILRDAERTSTGVFQGAFERLAWRNKEYIAILRIGKDSDVAVTATDRLRMVAVGTSDPVDALGSGESARLTQSFLNRGWVNWGYIVAS